ncbi:MAG: 23S rRNA (uracil(1939)-C(5))-methyltransferase RlmD [Terracidiphilus sp.]|jgi:23S rRNA (uracil1939-C5)-methyltransferase
MKKRARSFSRREQAAPKSFQQSAATPQFVQIEKPVYGGAFLARVEGKAVFVPLALPGEQARVRVVEEKRGYATAEVEEIVAAAAERVAPKCKHFGACGGCQYQHANYKAQIEMKQGILRETLERGGVRAPEQIAVLAGDPWAYRNRIRLAFDAEGRPGYRGRRSHAVIAIDECPIAAPLLVRAAFSAAELFRRFAVASRPAELSLFCDAAQSSMLASVFTDGAARVPLTDYFDALLPQIPSLRGVELVEVHQGQSRTVARAGAESLAYRAAGFDYRVDQGAFFQVNRWLVDELVECVTAGLHGGQAWDLFAGVGLFARKLAERFERVIAVESAPAAKAPLKHNLGGTNATAVKATTLEFLRGAANGERPDAIIVDPPRTGLGAETTELLGRISAPEMVYVSCDPATLARDLRALVAAGYAIERIALADLFPQTFHLETVVKLRR